MTLIQHVHPLTGQPLEAQAGGLLNESTIVFPCTDGVYRIVQGENYTGNFGYQWNKFQTTQIDSVSQVNLSRERFWTQTNWKPEALDGLNILEVGSGAGRFTQVLLQDSKANVYSVDYSDAVDANYRNNGPHERLHLYRASIYEMPFAPAQFDKVFCFGVLQHTPDVAKSVQKLIGMVKPGGELVVEPRAAGGTRVSCRLPSRRPDEARTDRADTDRSALLQSPTLMVQSQRNAAQSLPAG